MKRSEKLESETEGEIGVLGQEKRDKHQKEVNEGGKDGEEDWVLSGSLPLHLPATCVSASLVDQHDRQVAPIPDFISTTQRVLII